MVVQVEISSFDLRFQDHRLRHKACERTLLASIAENGIRDPLQGVDMQDVRILIDGFKRYRCAKMLGIGIVPYCCLSSDAASGIIEFLRISNKKSLGIVEQARLIEELKCSYQMSTADINVIDLASRFIRRVEPSLLNFVVSRKFPIGSDWLHGNYE